MKYFKLIVILLFVSVAFRIQSEAKILVAVGNNIITSYDVRQMSEFLLLSRGNASTRENLANVKAIAQELLINQSVKSIVTKRNNVHVTKTDIAQSLGSIANNSSAKTVKNLKKILQENGIDFSFFLKKTTVDLLWQKYIATSNTNLTVTKAEVAALKNRLEKAKIKVPDDSKLRERVYFQKLAKISQETLLMNKRTIYIKVY